VTGPLPTALLEGRLVLVVEDEYMIADEIAGMLAAAGAETLGPVARVSDALHLIAAAGRIDGALLDVNLRGEAVWPVVDALRARGVPVVLATGHDASAIPPSYAGLPRCEKPATWRDLGHALAQVLTPLASRQG
jgi:CheY-like chemotaxis protein